MVELTRKGKLNALLSKLARDFPKRKEWDRKWRIMIWDIPEDSRSQRNSIRWFVRNLGFYQLQQSVFITPHTLPYSAVQYLEESGLIKYIRLMRVDQMDNQNLLLKHFDLKAPGS